MEQAWETFIEFVRAEAEAAGVDIVEAGNNVAGYAVGRAQHLATLIGEPGFEMAARAEADNIALRAGILAVAEADAADERIRNMLANAAVFAAGLL